MFTLRHCMQRRGLHFFMIAGEPSGDILGASLIRSLRAKHPSALRVTGIGGPNMEREGLEKTSDMDPLAVMGFLEVLPHIPSLYSLLQSTVRTILETRPDFVVTLDSKGFNFRVIKAIRKELAGGKTKIVHYVAPSMWAIKGEQTGKKRFMSQNIDLLLVLFPFEREYFSSFVRTVCTGPPIFEHTAIRRTAMQELLPSPSSSSPSCKKEISDQVLLLLPGSRLQEVRQHMPILLEVVKSMSGQTQPHEGLTTTNDLIARKHRLQYQVLTIPAMKGLVDQIVISEGLQEIVQVITRLDVDKRIDHMRSCSAAVAVSGTVTLELAAALVPTVVIYRSNWFTEWLAKRLAAVQFISLPNLLLGRKLLPELLFGSCHREVIELEVSKMLFDEKQRARVVQGYREVMKIACPKAITYCTVDEGEGSKEQTPSMIAATSILELQGGIEKT